MNEYDVVIVTGSRRLKEHWRVWWVLDQYQPRVVVEGNCPTGADAAARRWLHRQGRPTRSYTAKWNYYGKKAGMIRNGEMLRDWPSACVLAFPSEGAENKGTADCMRQAWALGMVVENFSNVEVEPRLEELGYVGEGTDQLR